MDAHPLDGMRLGDLKAHMDAKRRSDLADSLGLSPGHAAVAVIDALADGVRRSFAVMAAAIEDLDKVPVKRPGRLDQRAIAIDLSCEAGKLRDTLCVYGLGDPGEPPLGLG